MGEHHGPVDQGHIGDYLRSVRESRRLSLDAVEEMTGMLPGSVTKSYLSRIENGVLEPTFPRLYALSQVYGLPIASLAERFEADLRRRAAPLDLTSAPGELSRQRIDELYHAGSYAEALVRIELKLDRLRTEPPDASADDGERQRLRIQRVSCLIYLDRLVTAKDACEDLLSEAAVEPRHRAFALYHYARCCYRMNKFPLAMMALGTLREDWNDGETPGLSLGNLVSLKGNILVAMDRPGDALEAFREAIACFDAAGDARSACRHRINYANVLTDCGKPRQARKHLTAALEQARQSGLVRQTAFALHGLGKAAYRLDEWRSAETRFVESNTISRREEYVSMIFCNCYYLWRIATTRGDAALEAAHRHSLRAYLPRVAETLAEARAFRSQEAGGVE